MGLAMLRMGGLALTLVLVSAGAIGCGKGKEQEKEKASLSIPGAGKIDVSRSGQITIRTEEGTVTMGSMSQVSEKDLGVPIYPGAQQEEGGGFMARGTGKEMGKGEGKWVSAVFSTPDAFQKVAAFYKEKAGSKANVLETSGGGHKNVSILGHDEKGGVTIAITRAPDESKTMIHITRIGGKDNS